MYIKIDNQAIISYQTMTPSSVSINSEPLSFSTPLQFHLFLCNNKNCRSWHMRILYHARFSLQYVVHAKLSKLNNKQSIKITKMNYCSCDLFEIGLVSGLWDLEASLHMLLQYIIITLEVI